MPVPEPATHECDTSENTHSPTTDSLAKRWIRMCHDHPICTANYSPQIGGEFIATHLIAVGEPGESIVCLIEELQLNKTVRLLYTALSHC
jgi:hypothetical protein